jgi:hypothetical protein
MCTAYRTPEQQAAWEAAALANEQLLGCVEDNDKAVALKRLLETNP